METATVVNIFLSAIAAVAVYLFSKSNDHEKRIQKIEDVQGTKLDNLTEKVDEIERSIRKLSEDIHGENSEKNALTKTLTQILKYMESNDKK